MINILTKSGNLAPYLRATSQSVASQIKPLSPVVPKEQKKIVVQDYPTQQTNYSLGKVLTTTRGLKIKSGVTVTTQVRYAHSDINVPDFSEYRRDSVKCPSADSKSSDASRKSFSYVIVGAGSVAAAYGAKAVVTQFVMTMSASKDVLAMAQIEIKLSDIPEGKSVVFKWRGKPLFIRHRTPTEIETERSTNVSLLRDPQHDHERVKRPEWLVVLGVCTHLGCVPIANAGDWNGYYCPCHGSHYDASGRIRKGPAPLNLEVPQHEYPEENLLVVG